MENSALVEVMAMSGISERFCIMTYLGPEVVIRVIFNILGSLVSIEVFKVTKSNILSTRIEFGHPGSNSLFLAKFTFGQCSSAFTIGEEFNTAGVIQF